MKYPVVALLIMTPAFSSIALGQDGGGHGPPKMSTSAPLPTATTSVPAAGSLSSFFQPRAELGSIMK